MTKPYLSAENISVAIGQKTILHGASINVDKGQFWTILGPNGSGKTTFLKTLGGWLTPFKGAVYLQGEKINTLERKQVARKMGMVSVGEGDSSFTVEQTVYMGRFSHLGKFSGKSKEDIQKVTEALEKVGMLDKKDRYINQLSQGERQKIWLARALAQDVDILLLDEPTSHLDVKSQKEIVSLLEQLCLKGELAVVAILHDINLALAFSTHLLLLQNGRVLACGEKKDVLTQDNLSVLYQIPLKIDVECNGQCFVKVQYKE